MSNRFPTIAFISIYIYLGLFLFNPLEKIELENKQLMGDTSVVVVDKSIFEPSLKNAMRDVFQVPFDLKWYNLCFVNKNTSILYGDGSESYKDITVSLTNLNNTQVMDLGEKTCELYSFDDEIIYVWSFDWKLNTSKVSNSKQLISCDLEGKYYHCLHEQELSTLRPRVYSYAKPELYTSLVKWILLFFSISGAFVLLQSLKKLFN
jgi:hypothetical protein